MPSPTQQAIRTLMVKSSEMRAQVERMLLLARLEDGAALPQMTPIDLRTVVTDAVDRVQPQVKLKEGRLKVDLANASMPVIGVPERLGMELEKLHQHATNFCHRHTHNEV